MVVFFLVSAFRLFHILLKICHLIILSTVSVAVACSCPIIKIWGFYTSGLAQDGMNYERLEYLILYKFLCLGLSTKLLRFTLSILLLIGYR